MPVGREGHKQVEINIVGSSVFGRYPKISQEQTINMFISQDFLIDYSGYKIIINKKRLGNGKQGRAIFTSIKLNALIVVIDSTVWLIRLDYNQQTNEPNYTQVFQIGTLETNSGVVYVTENNLPQILISDGLHLYIYDQTLATPFNIVPLLNFTPGYITFHDGYFLCSASDDMTSGAAANNTWRLSLPNQGYLNNTTDPGATAWPAIAQNVGVINSKPDNTQAVVRFPSKGNMIFVMGHYVTEAWFNTGAQLFPYQRNNQFNIDYGCVSPATVAYMDELVVWLAQNEKSGPIIMYSDGGMPKKITTDGMDHLFSTLQYPADSQGFLYRQDGHLFYHINFYADNKSFFYDFNTDKFYQATDQNLNYFIAAEIAFIGNQYYFVSKNTGHLYSFDTNYTTYNDTIDNVSSTEIDFVIPRIRICKNIRMPTQDYFIINDIGFTIESGETPYFQQTGVGNNTAFELLEGDDFLLLSGNTFNLLQEDIPYLDETPKVYLSMSYDGGASFGSQWAYDMPGIGSRRNRLMFWQCGMANDAVPKFEFRSIGRFMATNGIANIR